MTRSSFHFARLVCGACTTFGIVLAVMCCMLSLGVRGACAQLNVEAPATKGMDIVEHLGQKIPLDLQFLDPKGKLVKLGDSFNQGHKPVVLAMVYFRCPLMCPMVINNLQTRTNAIKQSIGEDYNVVLVTFDPTEGPTEARRQQEGFLAGYNREQVKGIEKSFQVLSGRPDNASILAESLGFPYRYLEESGEYSHGTVFFVLTSDGTISRYIYGVNYPAETLRMSLLEASEGKIGSAFERVIMWCYHFDPKTGTYTLQVLTIVNIVATSSALLVGAFLTRMYIVERRRHQAVAARIAGLCQSFTSVAPAPEPSPNVQSSGGPLGGPPSSGI